MNGPTTARSLIKEEDSINSTTENDFSASKTDTNAGEILEDDNEGYITVSVPCTLWNLDNRVDAVQQMLPKKEKKKEKKRSKCIK